MVRILSSSFREDWISWLKVELNWSTVLTLSVDIRRFQLGRYRYKRSALSYFHSAPTTTNTKCFWWAVEGVDFASLPLPWRCVTN